MSDVPGTCGVANRTRPGRRPPAVTPLSAWSVGHSPPGGSDAQCVAIRRGCRALRGVSAIVHTRAHAGDRAAHARSGARGAGTVRQRRCLDAAAGRRERGRGAGDGRRRPRLPRLRRRHRLPEHRSPVRAGRRRGAPAGRRVPPPVLHGRASTSRTSTPAACLRSSRPAPERSRSRSSSTPARRRTRTPSRSRAQRPDGRPSSCSTTRSTGARS